LTSRWPAAQAPAGTIHASIPIRNRWLTFLDRLDPKMSAGSSPPEARLGGRECNQFASSKAQKLWAFALSPGGVYESRDFILSSRSEISICSNFWEFEDLRT
jgi:hypothetical protein